MDNVNDLLEYNTKRPLLSISEYGRLVQKLINFACTVENREERNSIAKNIVRIMSQISPQQGDEDEWKHKLYDHLFIMSDFKLDIDAPYPKPSMDLHRNKAETIQYPSKKYYIRHYGRNLQEMVGKAADYPEGPEKDALMRLLIMQVKRDYITWNESSLNGEDALIEQLKLLSGGKIEYNDNMQVSFNPPAPAYGKLNKKGPYRGKPAHSGGGGGRNQHNNSHGNSYNKQHNKPFNKKGKK